MMPSAMALMMTMTIRSCMMSQRPAHMPLLPAMQKLVQQLAAHPGMRVPRSQGAIMEISHPLGKAQALLG